MWLSNSLNYVWWLLWWFTYSLLMCLVLVSYLILSSVVMLWRVSCIHQLCVQDLLFCPDFTVSPSRKTGPVSSRNILVSFAVVSVMFAVLTLSNYISCANRHGVRGWERLSHLLVWQPFAHLIFHPPPSTQRVLTCGALSMLCSLKYN